MKSFLLLIAAALSLAACDADRAQPRSVGGEAPKADGLGTTGDACEAYDRYSDGLCDPGCDQPDPDCFDCSTAARLAVNALEDVNDEGVERNYSEQVTEPGVDGKTLLRVRSESYEYLVNAQLRHESAGQLTEYCVVHGLQLVRRQVDLRIGDDIIEETPSDACGDAAADAVDTLERQHALGVLSDDGTRFTDEDEDGALVAQASSNVNAVILDHKESQRELIQVQVDRSAPWKPALEVYMVNTQPTDDGCRVNGLQSRSEQVDLRD